MHSFCWSLRTTPCSEILQSIKHCIIPIEPWCSIYWARTCSILQIKALYALLFSKIWLVKIWIPFHQELRFFQATGSIWSVLVFIQGQEIVKSLGLKHLNTLYLATNIEVIWWHTVLLHSVTLRTFVHKEMDAGFWN